MSKVTYKDTLLERLREITQNEDNRGNWSSYIYTALKQYSENAGDNKNIYTKKSRKGADVINKPKALKYLLEVFKDEKFTKTEPFMIYLQTTNKLNYESLKSQIQSGQRKLIPDSLKPEGKESEGKESEGKESETKQEEKKADDYDEDEDEDETDDVEEGSARVLAAAAPPPPSQSLRASAAMPAGGGERFEEIGLGDPRMAQLFPAVIPPGEDERKGGDEPPAREAVAPRGDAQPQPAREAVAPRGDAQPGEQMDPVKKSEINVLTKEELGRTSKDLADFIGKKPNKKTEMAVNEIGGFKAYQELRAKYKLKNIYKSELVADELKIDIKDYNAAELGVLYNAYLMNKFEINEIGGFKVGAVIDLKSLIGRQFTLKDLLSMPISGKAQTDSSAVATQASKSTMPPTGDINVGPVKKVELAGSETLPKQIDSVRVTQPERVAQKIINPSVNIQDLINKFPGSHVHQIPKAQQLTEDTKGNVVKYEVNVISKKKKLHFWDRI